MSWRRSSGPAASSGRPGPGYGLHQDRGRFPESAARDNADETIRQCLEILRDATSADAAFSAFFDATGSHIESVMAPAVPFAQCIRTALRGTRWRLPYGCVRAPNTCGCRNFAIPPEPRKRAGRGCRRARGAGDRLGAAGCISYPRDQPAGLLGLVYGLPRGGFDVNLQLLLKLLGSSLRPGLERVRLSRRWCASKSAVRSANSLPTTDCGISMSTATTYFSPRWRAMLGYDEADLKGGFDWRSLVHPDDMSRVQSAIRDHVAGKTPMFESVHRMRHRNGEWRWVISRAKAQLDAHGRLLRLVGVELDITEHKLYEEALFREKESAQITLQSIGDGVSPPMPPPPSTTSTRWPSSSPAGGSRTPWASRWRRSSALSTRRPASRWRIR
jgi:PAS domain S-box-containing protein